MDRTLNSTELTGGTMIDQICRHRSVRSFLPDPLPDGWLEKIISTAQWASSTCFRQTYSVIAIQNPDTKQTLAELCGRQRWIEQCPLFLAFCVDMNRLDEICEQRETQVNIEYTESLVAGVLDVGLFMQNAALAAESLGLGIVMIGGVRDNPREITQLLRLPKGVFCLAGMCVGFPMTQPRQSPRLPLEEVLHREAYGSEGRPERLAVYDAVIREVGLYRPRNGSEQGWTDVMARTTSKPAAEAGRLALREVLNEQGFTLK